MGTPQIILLVVLALFIIGWVVLTVFVKGAQKKALDELRESLHADGIVLMDDKADCYGIESEGVQPARGLGCLALTKKELVFVRWKPNREIRIDRSAVTAVEEADEHLGRARDKDLLKFRYRNGDADDSIAFGVEALDEWQKELGFTSP